jgi:alcohol dehydrogenase class IV
MELEPFSFGLDTAVTFGIGSRRQAGAVAAAFGPRVALVVGRHSYEESPLRADLDDAFGAAALEAVVTCHADGEPELETVMRSADAIRSSSAEVVIAIGGGSVVDLAKAAAIAANSPIDGATLAGGPRFDAPIGVPVVAIPTTAGSGAEVSRGAIVLDPATGRKHGIRGRGVAPRAAVVDPELVAGCPPQVTARAGFDAVAHAVETTVSRAAGPLTRALAIQALPLLLAGVPRSLQAPGDLAARAAASYAALLMGMNLANSTTCLPHRMQYPLGAIARSEHAVGVAALTPAWLKRVLHHAPERLAVLAPAIGETAAPDAGSAAALVAERITEFMARIELQPRLRDLGIARGDVPRLAAMVEGTLENDPGPTDVDALTRLYEESL